jgi:hypothetical protein
MRRVAIVLSIVALAALVGRAFPAGGGSGVNEEGFITVWLLLAPIPLDANQSGAEALGKQQIKDEALLQPKAGDKVKIGGKDLAWKEYKAREHFFDFNDFLGAQTEDCVGYAVCYIHAPGELKSVKLHIGSDDQAVVYLNGKQVIKNDMARALDKDQDTTDVTLKKGVNVLVFKVVNEKIDWSGCARFTDKDGKAIKDLRVTTTPK